MKYFLFILSLAFSSYCVAADKDANLDIAFSAGVCYGISEISNINETVNNDEALKKGRDLIDLWISTQAIKIGIKKEKVVSFCDDLLKKYSTIKKANSEQSHPTERR